MSKTTANLGLIKPEKSDNYSCDVMGENMDIIDEKLGKINFDANGNIINDSGFKGRTYTKIELVDTNCGEGKFTCRAQSASAARYGSATIVVEEENTYNKFVGSVTRDLTFPLKIAPNLWIESEDDIVNNELLHPTTRIVNFSGKSESTADSGTVYFYVDGVNVKTLSVAYGTSSASVSYSQEVPIGATCKVSCSKWASGAVSLSLLSDLYINTL